MKDAVVAVATIAVLQIVAHYAGDGLATVLAMLMLAFGRRILLGWEEGMIWPFRRRRKPVHVGPTSVDWKPGDMAECVEALDRLHHAPQPGDRLMVSDVRYGGSVGGGYKLFGLWFIGWGNEFGFDSTAFRKIVLTDTGADRKVGARERARKVFSLPSTNTRRAGAAA